jgi:hypothetical protein
MRNGVRADRRWCWTGRRGPQEAVRIETCSGGQYPLPVWLCSIATLLTLNALKSVSVHGVRFSDPMESDRTPMFRKALRYLRKQDCVHDCVHELAGWRGGISRCAAAGEEDRRSGNGFPKAVMCRPRLAQSRAVAHLCKSGSTGLPVASSSSTSPRKRQQHLAQRSCYHTSGNECHLCRVHRG